MAKPTSHLLDNEASEEFKAEVRKNCTIQLVAPDNHQQNLAEQAIQTFKSHFKAILAGVDDRFSDETLRQEITTNNTYPQSPCQSNVAPTVSAWQYVHGPFDYNKMSLAPIGCAVQIHKSSEQQGTWAPIQSMDGTFKPHLNIIDAIKFMSRRQKVKGYQTQYFSNTDTYLNQL
jgi:hypothetical protein